MTHGSFQPQAATLGLFLWSQTFLKNRCRKERELLLIWGPAPRPPGFFQGMGVYRPMRVKAGREAQLHAPFSSFDELTGLFLSAVASPQSRPPLHPLRSPYKPHDPAQVFFESDTTFLLLPVYHGHEEATRKLKQLVRAYENLSDDTQRTMVRIKAVYRSRGIACRGQEAYQPTQRKQWLEKLSEPGARQRMEWLYEELDQLAPLRRRAKQAVIREGGKHRAVALLRTIPQVGPLRSALIVATVDTPHRFRTKRQLWSYSGLAVVTHMSSEYQIQEDRVIRSRKPIATRGLNRNCNHRMKDVFIGAATGGAQIEPYRTYLERLEQTGMRAEMARLTLARKIAAVALSIWKKGEVFDPKKLNWTT